MSRSSFTWPWLAAFLAVACADDGTARMTDTADPSDTQRATDDSTSTDTRFAVDTADTAAPEGPLCPTHAGDECSLKSQDCSELGQACVFDPVRMRTACEKRVPGTTAVGDRCQSTSECVLGAFCLSEHCSPACCQGDPNGCTRNGECHLAVRFTSDADASVVGFYACAYPDRCHPFAFDCTAEKVCVASMGAFICATPSTGALGLGVLPGSTCKATADCGESQACVPSATADANTSSAVCRLLCNLAPNDAGAPDSASNGGTMDASAVPDAKAAGSRFAANGTCLVAGKHYGDCTAADELPAGYGYCLP